MLKPKYHSLKKKKEKYGELADCIFMSTFRKHGNTQRQLTRKIITCVTSFVLYAFHFVPSIPVLHPLAYIKPQTSQEQAPAGEQL